MRPLFWTIEATYICKEKKPQDLCLMAFLIPGGEDGIRTHVRLLAN